MKEMTHVFGDFDHPAFYVFAVLNGLVLLLPDRDEAKYRAGVFLARLFLFPYSLYFCVVFLPYLPLALFAIVFVGLGFLMLTPLVLTLVHLRVLLADYRYLKSLPAIRLSFRARSLVAAGLLSLALWPLAVSAAYYHERRTLHAALDYVYLPNHANSRAGLDTRALRKTLLEIRRYKASAGTPYLGLYYQWLVLDNLTVSDAKIDRLQRLFFGATEEPPQPDGLWGGRNRNRSAFGGGNLRPPSRYGRLIRASSRTIYDARTGVYRSVVDLTLSYPGTAGEAFDAQTEYQTRFRLPPGARVSEYYLDIAGKREYGMLAEKKSALWIYNQITGFRQDPGLLYYEDALTLALRVFPIPRGGRRTTGFEIVHVEPFALELDGRSLELSAPGPRPELIAFPEGLYISAAAKAKAPSGKRVPYYSFVLDCAGRDGGDPGETPLEPGAEDALYVAGMLAALEKEMLPGAARDVQVSCANYEFSSRRVAEPTAENLAGSLRDLRRDILRRGSFALGRTLRALLIQSSRGDQSGERFPVFFALTTRTDRVANEQVENLSAGLKNLSWITPESPNFYLLDHARSSGAPEPGFALRRYSFHGDVFAEPVAGGRINFSATAWFDLARLATAASPRGAAPSTGGPAIDRAVVVGRNETATVIPTLDRALDPAKTALATQGSAPGEKRRAARRADSGEQSNDRNETRATAAIILAAAAVESNHLLFPAEAAEFYGAMVRASFGAHLLLQSTSFLSVETEAQKLALKRKQDQVLRGHSALDAGEEPVRMDEPGFWVLAL
ncbi:MAG: MSEP-CTERM sorting domain-containing protein, partial [Leptospirales bacterium]